MKIKEVCNHTGLKDKTIRYYIRSGLIFPDYDENYTGRKNFIFSDEDIYRLKQIVILRKYKFSISDIKELFNNGSVTEIVTRHLELCKNSSLEYLSIIDRLTSIENKYSDINELCSLLNNETEEHIEAPETDNKTPYRQMYAKERRNTKLIAGMFILIIVFASIILTMLFSNIKAVTNSSVLSIGKGFCGIRIIESNEDETIYNIHDLDFIEDDFTPVSYEDNTKFFKKVDISQTKQTVTVNAEVISDAEYVRIEYLYKDKHTGNIVSFDGSAWVRPQDEPIVKSDTNMKSDNYKYQYELHISN